MALALQGMCISAGIAIGKAHILSSDGPAVTERTLLPHEIPHEVARLQTALQAAAGHLQEVRARLPAKAAPDIAGFIDTHLLMLRDEALTRAPLEIIAAHRCNAEWALKLQRDALVQVFDQIEDPYLRTRRDDVEHVVAAVQRLLMEDNGGDPARQTALTGQVVVAEDIAPADLVLLYQRHVVGLITEHGGPTSHSAILARSLRLPAIAVRGARRRLRHGQLVIVDGDQGIVVAEPEAAQLGHYRQRQRLLKHRRARLRRLTGQPALTRDGVAITLRANIELPEDIRATRRSGAAGVGLYRTEYLFMNRDAPPGEEEQLEAYSRAVRALDGAPLTIRSLDLGADKCVDGRGAGRPGSTNPALGLRAVRLCLREPGLFRPQLRAILRASAAGPVRLMVPMLCSIGELREVLAMVERVRGELRRQGLKYDPQLPVGAMIEVPAAALAARMFARHLDFLSIGTNDLIQYTLAVDRIDDEVSHLYDPLHPAVLRLIRMTVRAGRLAGKPVAMCGEMAGDARYTRVLLGLGLKELSLHPAAVNEIKQAVRTSDTVRLRRLVPRLLDAAEPDESAHWLEMINRM